MVVGVWGGGQGGGGGLGSGGVWRWVVGQVVVGVKG